MNCDSNNNDDNDKTKDAGRAKDQADKASLEHVHAMARELDKSDKEAKRDARASARASFITNAGAVGNKEKEGVTIAATTAIRHSTQRGLSKNAATRVPTNLGGLEDTTTAAVADEGGNTGDLLRHGTQRGLSKNLGAKVRRTEETTTNAVEVSVDRLLHNTNRGLSKNSPGGGKLAVTVNEPLSDEAPQDEAEVVLNSFPHVGPTTTGVVSESSGGGLDEAGAVAPNATSVSTSEDLVETGVAAPNATSVPTGGDLDLAVASRVPEEDSQNNGQPLQSAQEVNEDKIALRTAVRRNYLLTVLLVISLCCNVVLAIAVGLVASSNGCEGANDESEAGQEASPTLLIPAASLESVVLGLLPDDTVASIERGTTPQGNAFEWLLEDPMLVNYSDSRIVQRFAMATLFYATGGDGWIDNKYWLDYDRHECEWVIADYFQDYQFGTEIPHEYAFLEGAYNTSCEEPPNATGAEMASGQVKHLWFWNNNLKGTLPDELYLLSALKSISLFGDPVGGTISSHVGWLSSLKALWIVSNDIKGRLPTEIGLLSEVELIILTNMELTGTLPVELTMLNKLRLLNLDENKFTGTIHTEFGLLTTLTEFDAYLNPITGTIPTELGLITGMNHFLTWQSLVTGSIPSEMGAWTKLSQLGIASCSLTGTMPTELGLLTSMGYLFPDNNQLTGHVPTELGLLSTMGIVPTHVDASFTGVFRLDGNGLQGAIPSELGQLSSVQFLWLHNNTLAGSIPSELGMLSTFHCQ